MLLCRPSSWIRFIPWLAFHWRAFALERVKAEAALVSLRSSGQDAESMKRQFAEVYIAVQTSIASGNESALAKVLIPLPSLRSSYRHSALSTI